MKKNENKKEKKEEEEEKKRNCKEKREEEKSLFKNKDENYSGPLNQRTGKQESKLMLKKKIVNQPKNLYLLKLSFESEGEIFKNQDLEFITSQNALQEILRVI